MIRVNGDWIDSGSIKVDRINGNWLVLADSGQQIAGPFRRNRDAWRWYDLSERDPPWKLRECTLTGVNAGR